MGRPPSAPPSRIPPQFRSRPGSGSYTVGLQPRLQPLERRGDALQGVATAASTGALAFAFTSVDFVNEHEARPPPGGPVREEILIAVRRAALFITLPTVCFVPGLPPWTVRSSPSISGRSINWCWPPSSATRAGNTSTKPHSKRGRPGTCCGGYFLWRLRRNQGRRTRWSGTAVGCARELAISWRF